MSSSSGSRGAPQMSQVPCVFMRLLYHKGGSNGTVRGSLPDCQALNFSGRQVPQGRKPAAIASSSFLKNTRCFM